MEEASDLQEPPGLRRTGGLSADFTGALSFPLGVRVSGAAACSRAGCVADPPFGGDASGTRRSPKRYRKRPAAGSASFAVERQPLVR